MKKSTVFTFIAFLFSISCFSSAYGSSGDLLTALNALEDHITGVTPLTGTEIASHKATIDANKSFFETNYTVMVEATGLVETYDSVVGPLFINKTFWRSSTSDEDIDWVIFHVMQYIMDYSYTASNIEQYESLLGSFLFECSAKFPGSCDPPANPNNTHTATINASYPDTLGWLRQQENLPARKPTGTYLAPGTVVTVTVPTGLVNAGYEIRVGAHSWDMSNRPPVRRLDRSSLVFPIQSTQTRVANPLGGGIYIEVPYLADAGVVNVDITGAVRSPFYSYNTVTGHITTLSEWQNIERNHPAPWADFQTEKYMCQVPTNWIYNMDDPVTVMANWDLGIDINNDLMGFPHDRGKETYYLQLDVINRASVYAPGYPAVNNSDSNPTRDDFGGDRSHYFVRGPQVAPSYCMHEQGHAYFFDKFSGEQESAVNLAHVSVWNQGFGYDLDYAFAASRGIEGNPNRTLDNTAVTWMTVFNFAPRERSMAEAEKAYQLKGHAKFVDIAKLFGWQVIEDYYAQLVVEGINKNTTPLNDDDRILRMSKAAGVDLTPLFHFWGIHPIDPDGLAAAVAAEGLPSSSLIYDRLVHYRSLVPEDNAAFRNFALAWWGKQPSIGGYWTEREHTRQWDTTNYWESNGWTYSGTDPDNADGEIYTEASCARIQNVVDRLIEKYFPANDSVPPRTDPPTWEYAPMPGLEYWPLVRCQVIILPQVCLGQPGINIV